MIGCTEPVGRFEPAQRTIGPVDYDQLWETSLIVLREQQFRPDRQDRRFGVITTYPTVSGQWFEFWRNDTQSTFAWVESSLHTIRRTPTVWIEPTDQDNFWTIMVQVDVQRKREPAQQVTSASGGLRVLRGTMPRISGEKNVPTIQEYWVDVGEDPDMAEFLIDLIDMRTLSAAPLPEPAMDNQTTSVQPAAGDTM